MNFQDLKLLINSRCPVISIQSRLLERADTISWLTTNFAIPLNLPVFLWNLGMRKFKQVKQSRDTCGIQSFPICDDFDLIGDDCLNVLNFLINYKSEGVFILENLQSLMAVEKAADVTSRHKATQISSQIVNIFEEFKFSPISKYLLLLGTENIELPPWLADLIPEVWKPLPTQAAIKSFMEEFLPTVVKEGIEGEISSLSVAASGLSLEEIKIGLRHGLERNKGNSLQSILLDYKIECLRPQGLEFIEKPNVPDFGGLDRLKAEISRVKSDYSEEARAQNISLPKGWLLVGPPGTGKTLAAKVSARMLGFPLISALLSL